MEMHESQVPPLL